jgi:hypothetical protein
MTRPAWLSAWRTSTAARPRRPGAPGASTGSHSCRSGGRRRASTSGKKLSSNRYEGLSRRSRTRPNQQLPPALMPQPGVHTTAKSWALHNQRSAPSPCPHTPHECGIEASPCPHSKRSTLDALLLSATTERPRTAASAPGAITRGRPTTSASLTGAQLTRRGLRAARPQVGNGGGKKDYLRGTGGDRWTSGGVTRASEAWVFGTG